MNTQEIFDKIVNHLLTQNQPSVGDKGCLYHGPDGLKCAIGCCISDEEYEENMEGKSVIDLKLSHPNLQLFKNITNYHLLFDLQDLHDSFESVSWKTSLIHIAKEYGLKWNYINK